jgi:phenylpyruvate tautomerase
MPSIRCDLNEKLDARVRDELVATLSRLAAEVIGKPETYVMAAVNDQACLRMSGKSGPAAFVDVRSIGGLSDTVCRTLSAGVCTALHDLVAIDQKRIYLTFTEFDAARWGHNGTTFG